MLILKLKNMLCKPKFKNAENLVFLYKNGEGTLTVKEGNSMEMTEEKRGIWLNFPECTPEDGEQVVVKRNGWYEILVYNEYHQCWDDSEVMIIVVN